MGIDDALRERFCLPEWAIFFEVANGTGLNARRFADAVAMNCYPSRGLEIHGIEVKTDRRDWQRELANPAKAEEIHQYCDRWWLVTTDGVVRDGELPPTWGHIVFKDAKLRVAVQAQANPHVRPPTKAFVASLLRSAGKLDERSIRAAVDKETRRIREDINDQVTRQVNQRLNSNRDLAGKLASIKDATGIDLLGWAPPDEVIEAIRFATSACLFRDYGTLKQLRNAMEAAIKLMDDAGIADRAKAEKTPA